MSFIWAMAFFWAAVLAAPILAQSAQPSKPTSTATQPSASTASSPQGDLEQSARQAYESGNFEQALALYDAAIKRGGVKPTTLYNRAATLYKLNQLPKAKAAFMELLADPKWADLARYNLGLIAEQRGQIQEARKWYAEVHQNTSNLRLKTIAERKLAQLAGAPASKSAAGSKSAADLKSGKKKTDELQKTSTKPAPNTNKNTLLLSLGAVADDNATGLAEELSGGASAAEDTYWHGLVYGHTFWGDTKIYALGQMRQFQKFDDFNTRVVGAGLEWSTDLAQWQWRYGLRALNIAVAKGTLANQLTATLVGGTTWGNNTLKLRNNLSQFSTPSDYAHLQGWQNQMRASWQKKWGKFSLEPQLAWELNNRRNKSRPNTYYSYSPSILSAQLQSKYDLSPKWQIHAAAEWAQADYDGVNRLTDIGGVTKNQPRSYDRTTLSLGARYRLHRYWYLKLDYQRAQTNDAFALYSFDKNTLAVKIEFVR